MKTKHRGRSGILSPQKVQQALIKKTGRRAGAADIRACNIGHCPGPASGDDLIGAEVNGHGGGPAIHGERAVGGDGSRVDVNYLALWTRDFQVGVGVSQNLRSFEDKPRLAGAIVGFVMGLAFGGVESVAALN